MPTLDPVTQLFADSLQALPPIQTCSIADARALLARTQSVPVGKPGAAIADVTFPVGPTGSVPIRIVRPHGSGGSGGGGVDGTPSLLPVVMHFHGGGWILGGKATHDRLMREIAVGAGAVLFFVDYALSPEARYPVAIEQAYAATRYVVENAQRLHVDATRLAVLGDSAGGNIAAAVTLMAKQRRGPKIDLQVLLYPVTDAGFRTGSYEAFADGPWLTRAAMRWFWDAYLPDAETRSREITATPLNASIDQLRYLPDALVVVAENDVLRDEGEAYARKLSDAGVRVTCVRYSGAIHDFMLLNALADTPAASSAVAQVIGALRTAFG